MTRSIDDIYLMILPVTCCSGRSNSNTSLLLLDHPVHGSGTFVYFAYLINFTGIVKYPLGGCCLAGIDVGHNTDISNAFERIILHQILRSLCSLSKKSFLISEMCKCFISFCHPVCVFSFFVSCPFAFTRINHLFCKSLGHRFTGFFL